MDINFKNYKSSILVTTILFLGTGISYLVAYLEIFINRIELLSLITFPSVSVIIYFLLKVYNKYIWKYKFFNLLINVPNISGNYEGEIKFIHPIDNTIVTMKCNMKITQTASNIALTSFFKNSDSSNSTKSTSKVANIVEEENGTYSIIFTYENSGTPGRDKFSPHYGTNVLKFIKKEDGNYLNGYYYTNRTPQTKGEMTLKYINNNLNDEF